MLLKVFISYSTKDLPTVKRLAAALPPDQVKIYVADWSATAGVNLPENIKAHIVACDVFCVLWSHNAKESEWVPQEIGIAEANKKIILPIVTEPGLHLPGFIKNRKYIPAFKGIDIALQEFSEAISKHVLDATETQKQSTLVLLGLGFLMLMAFGKD